MFLLVSIALLIMVLFIGSSGETGAATLNGARRWLRFAGVSIQPSEIAKFGMIFFMCSYMARHKDQMRTFTLGLAPMLLVIGVIAGLIMLQPNMSMAVIVAGIGAILLYVGGMDERWMDYRRGRHRRGAVHRARYHGVLPPRPTDVFP